MNQSKGLKKWHQFINEKDATKLEDFIVENAVLYSPVVWTPIKGKKLVQLYLMAAEQIIANKHFEYVREIANDNYAVLEFKTVIEGISVEGVDMITFNEKDQLVDIKVMIRPLKAVNIVHQKMGEFLMKMKGIG